MSYSFTNKKILVLGGGVTGNSVVKFLNTKKPNFIILVDKTKKSDLANFNIKDNNLENFSIQDIDYIVKSPGINPNHIILQKAKNYSAKIITEIDIASQFFKGKTIGITGTDGKSTTTSLIHHLLSKSNLNCIMGGNIGKPFLEFAEKDYEFATLELSSYQLEDSKNLNLDISVFLNLNCDHLDRHKTLENYANAKFKIVNFEDKDHIFITNPTLKSLFLSKFNHYKGQILTFNEKDIMIKDEKTLKLKKELINISNFNLNGYHNIENLMAAILVCQSLGVKSDIIEKNLSSFKGLKYRFELVGIKNNISFINDSKATNLNSMLAGIQNENLNDIILILGGQIKKEPIKPLLDKIKAYPNCCVYLFGEAKKVWEVELKKILEENLITCKNLEEVFYSLPKSINKKKVKKVIFSPACPSFDQYDNFEKRGEHFNELYYKFLLE